MILLIPMASFSHVPDSIVEGTTKDIDWPAGCLQTADTLLSHWLIKELKRASCRLQRSGDTVRKDVIEYGARQLKRPFVGVVAVEVIVELIDELAVDLTVEDTVEVMYQQSASNLRASQCLLLCLQQLSPVHVKNLP
jgi:hypothetical protein